MLQASWDIGLGLVFRSKTSHVIFRSLSPEDKDNFLVSKIVDKISDLDFWSKEAASPIKITEKQIKIVIAELSFDPYGSYAVLKFPSLFQSLEILEQTLKKVTFEDLYDFVMARKENVTHFENYISKLRNINTN